MPQKYLDNDNLVFVCLFGVFVHNLKKNLIFRNTTGYFYHKLCVVCTKLTENKIHNSKEISMKMLHAIRSNH